MSDTPMTREPKRAIYVTSDGRPHHCGPYCEHPGQNGVHQAPRGHWHWRFDDVGPVVCTCDENGSHEDRHTIEEDRKLIENHLIDSMQAGFRGADDDD